MSKPTLLDLTQRVAVFCNAGSVNSINDTRESLQIATIIKETFEDLVMRSEIRTTQTLLQLQSISTEERPTHLLMQPEVLTVDLLKYKDPRGTLLDLQYKPAVDFVEDSLHLDPTQPNVKTVEDFTGILFNVKTDKNPQYWTIFENGSEEYVVLDSFNSEFEDTIQGVHVVAYGKIMPEFLLEDGFIPPLSTQQFPVLLSRAKVAAAKELKNQENGIEYDKARKQFVQVTQQNRSQFRGSTTWNNRQMTGRRYHF
jgi:hypothetical protein